MRKVYFLLVLVSVVACSEKKTDLSGNTPLKINDFNKAFKTAKLPISLADTNLMAYTDTIEIGRKALAQFVPAPVVEEIMAIKNNKTKLFPVFRIEKEDAYYLLLNVQEKAKQTLAVIVFSKKNKFLDFKILTEFNATHKGSQLYGKTLSINKEPSFLVEETKMGEDNSLTYEKTAWAYTDSSFRLIYFDSNKKSETKNIINPIDTLASNNLFSGDYARDNKNFISLRDYNSPNKYLFFLHFEKQEGTCVGELKGLLDFTKNQATFNEKGDPCIIHFDIAGNMIKIKEDGNCGNHRNMTCYFNDAYDKKRKAKKKK
jgi:hypothetical protein